MEKIAVIVTIKNEEKTLGMLLNSLEKLTKKPDEVVIVDGGSIDHSMRILQKWKPSFAVKILQKKGNRAVGRNYAIASTSCEVIAITDAGCELEKDWLKKITAPILKKETDVVAGYYASAAKTPFEQAAASYMLVLPKNVSPQEFLPATRSMAMTKRTWKKYQGFPEKLNSSEDYVFAKKLKKFHEKIIFVQDAIVQWNPPKTWKKYLRTILEFSYWDVRGGIFRKKIWTIFSRYFLFCMSFIFSLSAGMILLGLYAMWSIVKHMHSVDSYQKYWILPIMQCTTDITVMMGTVAGALHNFQKICKKI